MLAHQPISTQASPEGARNKKTPNAETIVAMEDALNGGDKVFDIIEELMAEINAKTYKA